MKNEETADRACTSGFIITLTPPDAQDTLPKVSQCNDDADRNLASDWLMAMVD